MRKILMALAFIGMASSAANAEFTRDEILFSSSVMMGTHFCPQYVTENQRQILIKIFIREGYSKEQFQQLLYSFRSLGLEEPEKAAVSCNALHNVFMENTF